MVIYLHFSIGILLNSGDKSFPIGVSLLEKLASRQFKDRLTFHSRMKNQMHGWQKIIDRICRGNLIEVN